MYNDEDITRFYDPNYFYRLETEDLPLTCPYRQVVPFPPFPQGPQGPPGFQGPTVPKGGPPSAPPNFTPSQSQAQQFGATPLAVDPGAIRPCLYRFVYIWPRRGRGFWAWLVFVGPRSVSGFRFYRNNWRYFGMDLRNISSFQCF
jgi:hypothetical protein